MKLLNFTTEGEALQDHMCACAPLQVYLGAVFSHGVVVEASLGPELFVALLALQGILELQGVEGGNYQGAHFCLLYSLLDLSI